VLIGLPRFFFPCGFHSATCLTIFPPSIRLIYIIWTDLYVVGTSSVASSLSWFLH
jgi:hypothetical protein